MEDREKIDERIAEIELELERRKASIPAHSIRPHQLLIIEELEDELADLKAKI